MNIKTIFINLSIFLLLAGLIEFTTGKLLPDNKETGETGTKRHIRLREHNPNKSKVNYPSDEYVEKTEALEQKNYPIEIDNLGFISNSSVTFENDLIVFLGGSTTECLYVDDSLRFPKRLETLLNLTGEKYKVLNAGVSGNNSMHSLNVLLNKVVPLSPKYCVLMHNVNDLNILLYEGTFFNENATKSVVLKAKPIQKLNWKGHLVGLVRGLFSNTLEYLSQKTSNSNSKSDEFATTRDKPVFVQNYSKPFVANLNAFIEICVANNITPILMTQFNRLKPPFNSKIYDVIKTKLKNKNYSIEEYSKEYENFNQCIKSTAKSKNITYFDLDSLMTDKPNMLYDVCHLNNTGSDYVAKFLHQKISRMDSLMVIHN